MLEIKLYKRNHEVSSLASTQLRGSQRHTNASVTGGAHSRLTNKPVSNFLGHLSAKTPKPEFETKFEMFDLLAEKRGEYYDNILLTDLMNYDRIMQMYPESKHLMNFNKSNLYRI